MSILHTPAGEHHSLSPIEMRRRWIKERLQQAERQGGMTLFLDGLAGMGKSSMLQELQTAALEDGKWQLAVAPADEFEAGEPYSFIERFIAASQIPGWYLDANELTDPIAVARECIPRLFEGESAGRVYIIDDAQWIDSESYRVLRYLIPRITRRNMLLAFGVRSPHAPGSFGEFLFSLTAGSHLDCHLEVTPLSAKAVSALVAERHGVAIPTSIAQQIVAGTGGSFLEIDSILTSMSAPEIVQLRFGWSMPEMRPGAANGLLLRTYQELEGPVQSTAELVSVAGHAMSVDEVRAAAKILGEPEHLEAAIAGGVLAESQVDGRITARHALLGNAIESSLTRDRLRSLSQALAIVTNGYRGLRHRMRAAAEWDSSLADEVRRYVERAIAERKYGNASELLRSGLEMAQEPDVRMELIESLALVHLQAKTGYLVLDLLEEIEQFPPSLLHELMFHVLAAHQVGHEISPEAVYKILNAEPKDADERTILAFFSFMVVILSMRRADTSAVPALIEHAKQLSTMAPEHVDDLLDPRLGWMVAGEERLVVLDAYQMVQAQQGARFDAVAEALPDLIRRIDSLADAPLKVDAMVAVAGAQIAIGQARAARAMAEHSVEILERVGEPWAAGTARVILGHCMVLYGELSDAVELMELTEEVTYNSLDVETRSSWVALRLSVAAITSDEHAESYLEQARQQREITWEGYSPDLSVVAECELARVKGDPDAVLRATSGPWVEKLRSVQKGFLTYRANALIDKGRLSEATALIKQLASWRGVQWQEYWGSLDWLQARLAAATNDFETAKWHYDAAIENREFPLAYGLTLADHGRFLHAAGKQDEGNRSFEAAIQELESIGAEGYLKPLRAEISATSGLDQNERQQQLLSSLTDRERQIVEQLVKGRSNNQIAESFVVSVATVRSHISNILRKLGLSSRSEVARLVREQSVSKEQ